MKKLVVQHQEIRAVEILDGVEDQLRPTSSASQSNPRLEVR